LFILSVALDWSSTLLLSEDICIMGSRANYPYKSIGIKYIKYYFLYKICLQYNSEYSLNCSWCSRAWRIYSTPYCTLPLLLLYLIVNLLHCLVIFIITLLYITALFSNIYNNFTVYYCNLTIHCCYSVYCYCHKLHLDHNSRNTWLILTI